MRRSIRREDLTGSDLLSETVLLLSGVVLFIPLLLILAAVFVEPSAH